MWFAAILLGIVVILLLYLDSQKPKNYPPGPKWLPVLGSAIAVEKARLNAKYLHKAAQNLSKQYCDNGVLGLRVGKDRIVITCNSDSIKEMLLNDDIDGRPKGLFYETRTWGKRRGVIMTDEYIWKEQRRFTVRHLKDFGFGRRGMLEYVMAESEQLLQDVKSKCDINNNNGAVISMNDVVNVYILNTLWSMMAGIRYTSEDSQLKELQNILFELFSSIDMVGALFSHFPILRYVAPQASGYKRFVQIHEKIWKFLKSELDKHKESFKLENEDRDFMDAYLRKIIQTTEKEGGYTDGQLLALCMDMFMAGTETTSKSMGFAFLYLVREQEVQKKAQQEIDSIIGKDRLPTLNDRSKLPYNEAIVLEAMRHFMGRTFGIPHRALKETTLCGYTIPKDAMVVANFYGILMDEKLFEKPEVFRPERFLTDGKVTIPDAYIPFGIGKRRCIGESLARSNLFMFITTMLQNFEFKPVSSTDLPSLDIIDGATPAVTPFDALVIPRNK